MIIVRRFIVLSMILLEASSRADVLGSNIENRSSLLTHKETERKISSVHHSNEVTHSDRDASESILKQNGVPFSGKLNKEAAIYYKKKDSSGNLIESDIRTPVTSSKYPWRTIGRLERSDGGSCTATLIGSCYLLTAAHCVSLSTNGIRMPTSLKFNYVFNERRDNKSVFIDLNNILIDKNYGKKLRYDWAILKLNKSIGNKLGWMGLSDLSGPSLKGKTFKMVGYPADRNPGASLDPQVTVHRYHKEVPYYIYFDANAFGGASGSALFETDQKGQAWISGIITQAFLPPNYLEDLKSGYISQYHTKVVRGTTLSRGIASAGFAHRAKKFMNQKCP